MCRSIVVAKNRQVGCTIKNKSTDKLCNTVRYSYFCQRPTVGKRPCSYVSNTTWNNNRIQIFAITERIVCYFCNIKAVKLNGNCQRNTVSDISYKLNISIINFGNYI